MRQRADIRERLLSVVEDVERKIGDLAVIIASDGTLTHPRLVEALHKRPDGELLQAAITSCFPHPDAGQAVVKTWPSTVKGYESRPNTDELVNEKAFLLAGFVVHNLGVGIEARAALITQDKHSEASVPLTDEQEMIVKIEETACWYRIIGELAYRFIRDNRNLFVDLFLDNLSYLLALQGLPPDVICETLTERSEEYAQYREVTTADAGRTAGTVLWNAGKHVAVPLGFEHDPIFTTMFENLFVGRLMGALVYEFLTGKERIISREP